MGLDPLPQRREAEVAAHFGNFDYHIILMRDKRNFQRFWQRTKAVPKGAPEDAGNPIEQRISQIMGQHGGEKAALLPGGGEEAQEPIPVPNLVIEPLRRPRLRRTLMEHKNFRVKHDRISGSQKLHLQKQLRAIEEYVRDYKRPPDPGGLCENQPRRYEIRRF